jgi:purine-nucleoside phosphorylase
MNHNNSVYPIGKLYHREDVEQLAQRFRNEYPGFSPEIGLVIGTGFASFTQAIEDPHTIPYKDLPLFLDELQTPGHIGEFVLGKLSGRNIICARGKMFLLDGVPAQIIALPIRLFHALGCRSLLYTNTVGAINPSLKPGEFVFLHNHINLMGHNPLVGEKNGEWGPMFFDMTYPYDNNLRELGEEVARQMDLRINEGVYGGLLGPSFETAAEIKMLSIVGADVVGMSTVMEVIAARQLGMKVLAISFISNMAAGVTSQLVENDDVMRLASSSEQTYSKLIKGILAILPADR